MLILLITTKNHREHESYASYQVSDHEGLPGSKVVKNPPANAGDTGDAGSIPGLGRSLGEGNVNPPQYSCLGNPVDRGAWWAAVHGVAESQTRLSD